MFSPYVHNRTPTEKLDVTTWTSSDYTYNDLNSYELRLSKAVNRARTSRSGGCWLGVALCIPVVHARNDEDDFP